MAHPCNFPLKLTRVKVPNTEPFFPYRRQFHERPGVPAARLPITRFEHPVLVALPDHQGVVKPQLDESVPPESIMAGTWFSNLYGLPQFRPLDGDRHDPPVGISQANARIEA